MLKRVFFNFQERKGKERGKRVGLQGALLPEPGEAVPQESIAHNDTSAQTLEC